MRLCVRTEGQRNRGRLGAGAAAQPSPARLAGGRWVASFLSAGPRGQGLRGSVSRCNRKTGSGAGGGGLFRLALHIPRWAGAEVRRITPLEAGTRAAGHPAAHPSLAREAL